MSSDAGQILCPDPLSDKLGEVLEVADGHVIFDSRRPHCTMDWEGEVKDRVVLAAYTPLSTGKLTDADAAQLGKLGFVLPGSAGVRPRVVEPVPAGGITSPNKVSSGSSVAVGAQHPGHRDPSALDSFPPVCRLGRNSPAGR